MFSIGRPSPTQLEAALQRARGQALTYPEVGATAGDLPPGYGHVRREVLLGHGDKVFTRAARGLRRWGMHRQAGLLVRASAPAADPGTAQSLHQTRCPAPGAGDRLAQLAAEEGMRTRTDRGERPVRRVRSGCFEEGAQMGEGTAPRAPTRVSAAPRRSRTDGAATRSTARRGVR